MPEKHPHVKRLINYRISSEWSNVHTFGFILIWVFLLHWSCTLTGWLFCSFIGNDTKVCWITSPKQNILRFVASEFVTAAGVHFFWSENHAKLKLSNHTTCYRPVLYHPFGTSETQPGILKPQLQIRLYHNYGLYQPGHIMSGTTKTQSLDRQQQGNK